MRTPPLPCEFRELGEVLIAQCRSTHSKNLMTSFVHGIEGAIYQTMLRRYDEYVATIREQEAQRQRECEQLEAESRRHRLVENLKRANELFGSVERNDADSHVGLLLDRERELTSQEKAVLYQRMLERKERRKRRSEIRGLPVSSGERRRKSN